MRIFRTIKLSENIGSGFYKMFSGWTHYYAKKPVVEGDFDYYKINFYLAMKDEMVKRVTEKVTENQRLVERLGVKLGVNQVKILRLIGENKFITIVEIAAKLGISSTAVENNITKMLGFIL